MRKAHLVVALVLGAALLSSGPATAGRRVNAGYKNSWGKAGVSIEEYWLDSAQCAHQAADTDLEGTPPADALVLASRRIENHWNYEDIMMALRLAAPEHQWDRAAEIMQAELEDCLTGRGYVKFKLTDGQYKRLRKLDQGSVDRRRYLHSLASDPDVLAAQAIAKS